MKSRAILSILHEVCRRALCRCINVFYIYIYVCVYIIIIIIIIIKCILSIQSWWDGQDLILHSFLFSLGEINYWIEDQPSVSQTTPPASRTIRSPAAMSHMWIPYVKWASKSPDATMHICNAALPMARKLLRKFNQILTSIDPFNSVNYANKNFLKFWSKVCEGCYNCRV